MLILSKTLSVALFIARLYIASPEIVPYLEVGTNVYWAQFGSMENWRWGSQEGCFERQMTLLSSC